MSRTPIDFTRLASALLDNAQRWLEQWLPGGRRQGPEYLCGDLSGGKGESLSINIKSGMWADFANDDKGGDLISLYAAINGLNNAQAAIVLMGMLGWDTSAYQRNPEAVQASAPRSPSSSDSRPEPPPEEPQARKGKSSGKPEAKWRTIVPVPPNAPEPTFKHHYRGIPSQRWAYTRDGQLLGHVCRFIKSDGDKETLPYTWCQDDADDRGLQKWTWRQWDEPRPLFLAAGLLAEDPRLVPVVLVEGEKCAEAGHKLLGHEFDFVSWPGGSNAWGKADWTWLRGRVVFMWPDCDSKHFKLTAEERKQGVDPKSKPLLPEAKQPGIAAMLAIGTILAADMGCTVSMVRIPAPGNVTDGWDIADAIEQGWDAETVRNYIRAARAFTPPDEAAAAKARSTPSSAAAGDDADDSRAWRLKLLTSSTGATKAVRENVTLALENIEEVKGLVAYNEFTNDIMKMRDAPWGSPKGVWDEVDELLMGEWLTREHYLPSMPRGTLEEAVRMVAYRQRYHPVRVYLNTLKWDNTPRLREWLIKVCLEEDEHPQELQRYLARVGTWFLQGMVARVMEPGVKFDYMLILEGKQGLRKSTVFKVLAGDFFADTGLVMGDKDSYQQLQGRWLYEFAELDAMAKSEVTKVKAFIASASDYFRASFDKRARDYPRQVVFGGTTNEDTYLTDPTGNRRFWPVKVERVCNIEWLQENRDQLLAEAMQRWRDDARMYPTHEEEALLFEPEQNARAVENAIEESIARWLASQDGSLVDKITCSELLGKIGIGIEKLGPGRHHEKQAAAALKRLGWKRERSTQLIEGRRPWYFKRPIREVKAPTSTPQAQGHTTSEEDDEHLPF